MKSVWLFLLSICLLPSVGLAYASQVEPTHCSVDNISLSEFDIFQDLQHLNQIETYCRSHNSCFSGFKSYKSEDQLVSECVDRYKDRPDQCGGLTAVEIEALKTYTAFGYRAINSSTWKDDKKCEGIVSTLNQALAKIPKYQSWVFRGTNLPPDIRRQHQKNKVITYKAFTSTSSRRGWRGKDQFLIFSKNGASIADLSSLSSESEVLFPSNTQFKIVEKIKGKRKVNLYVMIEIDRTLSKEENLKREKEIYQKIETDISKIKKQIKGLFVSKHKARENAFNTTKFSTNKRWKCTDGISNTDFLKDQDE